MLQHMKAFVRYVYVCLILVTSVHGSFLSAQTRNFYSTENGLSSSLINHLFQDSRGFIWIATEYGLNRFDGSGFTNYQHVAGDSASLATDYSCVIFEDSRHNLFVGCANGLMMYDRETDAFREIPMIRSGKQVMPHVTHLQEVRGGEVWLSTSGQGMFRLDSTMCRAVSVDDLFQQSNYIYQSTFYVDSLSDIWIGTFGNGLARYVAKEKQLQSFEHLGYGTNEITSIAEYESGNIFVGTRKHGVFRYDKENGRIEPVPYVGDDGYISVYCMAVVDGKLWVGTDGQGVKIYNPQEYRLEDYKIDNASVDFSRGKVHAIMQDRDGNLWLGLYQKGVVLIPKQENPFEYYGNKSIYYNPIGQGCVVSVFQDSRQHLWVGIDNEGLYELDKDGKRLHHYAPGNGEHSVPNTIMCIYEDSEHNLWLGSFGEGSVRLNRETGRCEPFSPVHIPIVYSIAEDKEKNLYIGAFGAGFYQYNLTTHELTHYESSKDEKNDPRRDELLNDWISYIFCDSEGIVWLGHYRGVSCFNPKTKSFLDNRQRQNSLITDCIGYAFAEDHDGNIWAGTSTGLYCFSKKTGGLRWFTTGDGLPNNVICGICEDEEGNIWVSTYHGLSKYDVKKDVFVNYYSADGLQGNEFSHGAYYKSGGGRIYFGGVNGITHFSPKRINADARELNVCITDFYVYNRPIHKNTLSDGKPIISSSVQDAKVFRLSHHDNTFSIAFSTLQYNNPEQVAYQYRIKELDDEWSATKPGVNRVTYNNLRPGKYTFLVRSFCAGNYSKTHTVGIWIASPWFKTWWAYCLYACLATLVVAGGIYIVMSRVRYRREIMKREHDEQLSEAKLQFFMNISHEIRTPMTLIINPLEKLMADEKKGELHKTYLMIYRNAQRILRLINQLMDVRKIDKGQMFMKLRKTDMVGFVADVMQPFEYTSHKRGITFTFMHNMPQLEVWIDLNNFDKVLMNVLSNAFKYTPDGGEIEVALSVGRNSSWKDGAEYFEVTVTDSGVGIDEDKIERIFERFYQIDNDATKSNLGTGIGLHLSRSLVELHHGSIHAEKRTDAQGSRFVIRLPMGSGHLTADEMETSPAMTVSHTKRINPESSFEEETAVKVSAAKPKTRLRILVAEDDAEIRAYLKAELSDEYKVTVCNDGKEAYDIVLRDIPDLVVSDIMMPEMDGLTLCHKLKQNTVVNHIPVVLLTAKTRMEDTLEGMEAGADAYIVKPFNTEHLKRTIANLITNRRLLRSKFSGAQQQEDKVEKISIKSNDEQFMERIMRVINKHLDDPELNVEMLASEVGFSRVHIHRRLKELTNLSTRDFIKNIRLQQAASLLKQNLKLTVSEVAYAVGYSNLSHFSNSFKEKFGVSPKEYMNRQ